MKYLKIVVILVLALIIMNCGGGGGGLPSAGPVGNLGPNLNAPDFNPVDSGNPGPPGPGNIPDGTDPGCEPNCTSMATLGSGTVTYKVFKEAGNASSGYQMFSAAIGPQNFLVFDENGNGVPIEGIDVPIGTAMSFRFFINQVWGIQCVSHFEISANNFSSLSFEGISEDGANNAVSWGTTTSDVGETTLRYDNADCMVDPADEPILASLGSGSVTYKVLSDPSNPDAGFQLFTASVGLQNFNVFDEFGALLDKNNLLLLPGTSISFAFYINAVWQVECVSEYHLSAENLSGLAFAGISPVQEFDAVSFDTSIEGVGATSLKFSDPSCAI